MSQKIKKIAPRIGLGLIIIDLTSCSKANIYGLEGTDNMAQQNIAEVLNKHSGGLMATPGVVGTAQGLCGGKPCIRVFVMEKTPEIVEKIPKILEGYKVVVEETGEIRSLPEENE